jgi:hypothetical protein
MTTTSRQPLRSRQRSLTDLVRCSRNGPDGTGGGHDAAVAQRFRDTWSGS